MIFVFENHLKGREWKVFSKIIYIPPIAEPDTDIQKQVTSRLMSLMNKDTGVSHPVIQALI